MRTAEIYELLISFKVKDQPAFDLLLRRDGSISRLGTGVVKSPDPNPYRGFAGPFLFRRLLERLPPSWTLPFGQYETREKRGPICELVMEPNPKGRPWT